MCDYFYDVFCDVYSELLKCLQTFAVHKGHVGIKTPVKNTMKEAGTVNRGPGTRNYLDPHEIWFQYQYDI